jgi:hypothetical protein
MMPVRGSDGPMWVRRPRARDGLASACVTLWLGRLVGLGSEPDRRQPVAGDLLECAVAPRVSGVLQTVVVEQVLRRPERAASVHRPEQATPEVDVLDAGAEVAQDGPLVDVEGVR